MSHESGAAAAPEREQRLTTWADRLWRAELDRVAIEPIVDSDPSLTVEDAYAIQALNVARRAASGLMVRGHKVGLTSRVVQQHLGVSEPNSGVLTDDMFVVDGGTVAFTEFIQPRVEAEIAFVMGSDLTGPGVGVEEVRAAIRGVRPALEIGDSRIANWRIHLADTVADNGSSGRLVLGGEVVPITNLDLRTVGVVISRNNAMVHTGAGAAVLGDPVRCVAWLVNRLAESGAGLREGEVVLSGALHRMIPVFPGDSFRAEFGHLGQVSVRFAAAEREP